jgi:nitrite reductase (NO-forming)
MRRLDLRTVLASVFVLVVFVIGGLLLHSHGVLADADHGMVWGAPPAEVFTEEYDGPTVAGETLTRVPSLARLAPGGRRTHRVRMDILAAEIEIAPGVRYEAWTFGGSVPGPVLHVREGDRVVFTMKNRTNTQVSITSPAADASPFLHAVAKDNLQKPAPALLPMPHSIDFHAGTVAADDKWRMIAPGQTIRFEWVANYPGVYLYHCGVAPILMHMAMGQYGVVVVSPRNGFPTDAEVDREYVVVQSEFYLKAVEGGLHTLDLEAAAAKQPSQVAFNGHTGALTHAPLAANAGDRVRLYVHNVGPSDTSSFHVVGAIFDRVFYEGNPRNDSAGMQTVVLGASNGAVVEFIAPEEGKYILVDHEFADANRGAVGFMDVRSASGAITKAVQPMAH